MQLAINLLFRIGLAQREMTFTRFLLKDNIVAHSWSSVFVCVTDICIFVPSIVNILAKSRIKSHITMEAQWIVGLVSFR